ncbi:hypothetical protein PHACT_05640 [Pseudohongiella acticola]|uniref:Uncharacterized protein n=1 Tax=Pseudohongiella acticola TaxID=1524254 RepID=A0A1E8CK67_9GAMM|nr:hypothetical protein PHACT_05640 [Pseudohongiella acticola]
MLQGRLSGTAQRTEDRHIKQIELRLKPDTLPLLLALAAGFLLVMHVWLTFHHYRVSDIPWVIRQLFDVDEENNIPTWFSSANLLLTAMLTLLLATGKWQHRDRWRMHWILLGSGFLLLSLDEMAGLHESLNVVTEASWAIYALPLMLIIAIVFMRFLYFLPARTASLFVLSGLIFLGGAVGVELYTEPFLYNDELNTLAYNLWTAVEEGMEMFGIILFQYALLEYMSRDNGLLCKIAITD